MSPDPIGSDSPIYHFPISFLPINPIIPFSKRDGYTFIEALNYLRDWLEKELLPNLNNRFEDMAEKVQAAIVELETAIEIVRGHAGTAEEAAGQAAAAAEKVKEVLTQVTTLAEAAGESASAAARDADEIKRLLETADARYALKAHTHAGVDIAKATTTALGVSEIATSAEVAAGTANSASGNPLVVSPNTLLSFERSLRPYAPYAVAIGASNLVPGTWFEQLCALEGWIPKNFAIGGTGIMVDAAPNTRWRYQVENAANDGSFSNDEVGVVFVAGGGVDAINVKNVELESDYMFGRIRTHFKNARLIVVPGLWRNIPVRSTVIDVVNQMRRAAMKHGGEVIWHSWEWLYGRPDLMEDDEAHPNAAGYKRFIEFTRLGLRGCNTDLTRESSIVPGGAVNWGASDIRIQIGGGFVTLDGTTIVSGDSTATFEAGTMYLVGQIAQGELRPGRQKLGYGSTINEDNQVAVRIETTGMIRIKPNVNTRVAYFNSMWRVGQ